MELAHSLYERFVEAFDKAYPGEREVIERENAQRCGLKKKCKETMWSKLTGRGLPDAENGSSNTDAAPAGGSFSFGFGF